jgi:hypothetical protein
MIKIKLPSTLDYYNLYTLSGITPGKSIVVTSQYTRYVLLERAASKPASTANDGYPLAPGETTIVYGSSTTPIWVKGEDGYVVVQELSLPTTGQHSTVDLPQDFYTSTLENYRRIRVDTGQTSFFRGRQFRSYSDFTLAAAEVRYFRFTSLTDFVLFDQTLSVSGGSVRLSVWTGATASGTWAPIPVIGKNRMSSIPQPPYVTGVTFETGGTFTGGTEVEVIRLVSATATAQQSTVGANAGDERGLPASTFYIKVEATNSTPSVLYSLFWEER